MARESISAVTLATCLLLAGRGTADDARRVQRKPTASDSSHSIASKAGSDGVFDDLQFNPFDDGEWTDDPLAVSDPTEHIGDVVLAGGSESGDDSAKFPRAYQIPGTNAWWKFGGYLKADFIHDFEPAGTPDRFVPITIPTDGDGEQNTLLQAKATRLNLDVRTPSEWGTVRGFVEGDFFTPDNMFRLRHAYSELDSLLVGQTWTAFTDPDSIPRTLDFESPIAFIVLRQTQIRWTQPLSDSLNWVISIENPTTTTDDIVRSTIPGVPKQPIPDFVTRLKYEVEWGELMIAGLFRELVYRPDAGPTQEHFGFAVNTVGVLYPTDDDKIIAQFVMGNGLGRYRSGSDLGLYSPTTVDGVTHIGACFSVMHKWTESLSSTGAYSFAQRRDTSADPPDTPRFANYLAVNLIWEPTDNTSMGIEYLFGTNETKDEAYGYANRLQASVQYNIP